MKKLIAMLLVLVLVFVGVYGCDDAELDASIGNATSNQEEETKKPTEGDNQSTEANAPEQDTEPAPSVTENEETTIEETVIYDDNDIKITVKGLEDSWSGPEIKVLVENNSEHNIVFSGSDFIVNGITISGNAYIDVAAGKKSNDTISFYDSVLEAAGIEDFATIEGVDTYIYDSDSYDNLYTVPFVIETSIADSFVQKIDDSGDVLFEGSGVKVIGKLLHEEYYGYTVILYVKNDTGKEITVSADDISVNGFTITAWMYDTVFADTVRFCELTIPESELEDNDITDVEDITFTIEIIDPVTYDLVVSSGEIEVVVE